SMKKHSRLLYLAILFAVAGCNKDEAPDQPGTPTLPTTDLVIIKDFSVSSISFSAVYFLVTDEQANVVSEVKYTGGDSDFTITSSEPYDKERLNFFVVKVPASADLPLQISGYLQVKKGST